MREYSKVYPQIWIGETGRQLKDHGIETQFLAHYLITSPHANMVGIYYLPVSFISHETGMSAKVIAKAMANLIKLDYCLYDESKEYVWVKNMARFQVSPKLNLQDNMVKYVNSYFKNLPVLKFRMEFYQKYAEAFHLAKQEDVAGCSEGASEVLRSQEKENETDKEKEREIEMECAESQNDSALIKIDNPIVSKNIIKLADVLTIPLKNGSSYLVTKAMIDQWQKSFPAVNVLQVLRTIQEWNQANPRKRKQETGILRHINLWLAREEEKYKQEKSKALFTTNKSIADEWSKQGSGELK
jgi:hypothetical protein